MGEGGGGRLRLLDSPAEQAAAAHNVLGEQLPHDDVDVADVHLVDEAVQRLLQGLPG